MTKLDAWRNNRNYTAVTSDKNKDTVVLMIFKY